MLYVLLYSFCLQDFHARLNHDLVELNPASQSSLCQKPAVKITSFNNVKLRPKPMTTPILPRKPRPVSSGNVEMMSSCKPAQHPTTALSDDETSASTKGLLKEQSKSTKNQLSLLMYVIGGRVGQVTVFNGPISLWKLDLTKTF